MGYSFKRKYIILQCAVFSKYGVNTFRFRSRYIMQNKTVFNNKNLFTIQRNFSADDMKINCKYLFFRRV